MEYDKADFEVKRRKNSNEHITHGTRMLMLEIKCMYTCIVEPNVTRFCVILNQKNE